MTFSDLVHARRSVRKFEPRQLFDHHAVTKALELAILAPNSSNLQTWEFYRVADPATIESLVPLCLKQSAARTASELVIFVARQDLWKKRCAWHLQNIHDDIKAERGNPSLHQKAIRYYTKSLPALYRTDWFGIFRFLRWANLVWYDLRGKALIRWKSRNDIRLVCHKSVALAAAHFMLAMKDQGFDTCPMEGFDEKKVKKRLQLPGDLVMIVACGKGAAGGVYYERKRLPWEEVVFEVNPIRPSPAPKDLA
jgi:nitroreductase